MQSRKISAINIDSFVNDIRLSPIITENPVDISVKMNQYNSNLARILENHAPLITREIIIRPAAPWYTEEIKSEKRIRRKLERIWRKSKQSCDRLKYNQQCRRVSELLSKSRTRYYSEIAKDNKCNQRKLFKTFGKLLHHNPEPQYPACRFGENLADNFMTFFEDKINKI